MPSVPNPRILLCAAGLADAEDVRGPLIAADYAVVDHPLGEADPNDLARHDLILLDGHAREAEALKICKRFRLRLGDDFVPLLFILGDIAPAARLACLEAGADAYLVRPFAPGELLAQVQAFLRIRQLHARLSDKTAEVHVMNLQLQRAHQQIDQELEAARRIQMSFLPQALPEVPQARLAVHYRPCGRVGGDFYDAFRLDENHLGFYIADAMGHGVPASLLTIFLKRGVRPKEITGKNYRLVPPDEVLQKLNRDLLEQDLAEQPFITMVYVLLNFRTGELTFSRAGHPHPLYLPKSGNPEMWELSGSLLGVFQTRFSLQSQQLRPGDKLLLFTDGLDTLRNGPASTGKLLDCALAHRALPIRDLIEAMVLDLTAQLSQEDDFTLLGLEMMEC